MDINEPYHFGHFPNGRNYCQLFEGEKSFSGALSLCRYKLWVILGCTVLRAHNLPVMQF